MLSPQSTDSQSNFDYKAFKPYPDVKTQEKLIEARERQLWAEFGNSPHQVEAQLQMMERHVQKAMTRWACITAKSQHEKKFSNKNGCYFEVNTYQNMTEIKPGYERPPGTKPPEREGQTIQRFTERSRQRLMSKARKLNKSYMKIDRGDGQGRKREEMQLPIPYFVTLTYHKNFQNPEIAKGHLNNFLQRWRHRGKDFAYFWKMEPQKRGAVHFHLAMFMPEDWQDESIKRIRKCIQHDWAVVTKDVDGIDVPFTRFDYIRKKTFKKESYKVKGCIRQVETLCANPRVEYKIEPDWEHEWYGTNVRKCENWKQFLGYIYSYMKKEVSGDIWQDMDTGRFWAFSYNLDFEALQRGVVDYEDLENMNDFCNALNSMAFASLTKHLIDNTKRDRAAVEAGKMSKKEFEGRKRRYRNTFKAQKRRFSINRDKIKRGYLVQFEIKARDALEIRYLLKEKEIEKAFGKYEKALHTELKH